MEWIRTSERMPSADELDVHGCVLAWHLFSGCVVIGAKSLIGSTTLLYWMPCPKAPEGAEKDREAFNRTLIRNYGVDINGRFQ